MALTALAQRSLPTCDILADSVSADSASAAGPAMIAIAPQLCESMFHSSWALFKMALSRPLKTTYRSPLPLLHGVSIAENLTFLNKVHLGMYGHVAGALAEERIFTG